MRGNRAIMARQRVAAGSLPLSGGRRPPLTPHSVLILTFSHQRSQHAKNQAGRYAAGRRRQAAGEQKQPLHRRNAQTAAFGGQLHQGFVDQGLTDIPQEARNTRQGAGPAQKQDMQQGLSPAIAANLVQVQGVGIAVHHTGQQEQGQLHQGVVHHIQHRAVGGQGVVLPQQGQRRRAHQDKADLGQGGAGQNILEVVGEHGDGRAQHHGHRAQRQQQDAPPVLAGEKVRRDDQGAEDACLGEDAGQQGAGRGRGHRVGLGQPDVQREHARLGRKAEEDAQRRRPQLGAVRHPGAEAGQVGDDQGAGKAVQQEQAHQGHKAAQHRDGQIGLSRVQGVGGLLLHHPGIGTEAHQLEEQEGGVQVRRQEHAHGEAQAQQEEKVVAPQMVVAPEILGRQQG